MQQRRQFLRMSLGLGALGAGLASQAAYLGAWQAAQIGAPQGALSSTLTRLQDRLIWGEKIIQGFGTTLWLRAAHTRESRLQLALSDAVQALREVEHLMSLFDAQSLLQRLNREGVVSAVPPDFYRVLALSQHISERSQGAFDVSMQPLWRLWADWAQQQNMRQAQAEAASQITPFAALGAHQRSAQLSAGFLADLTKAARQLARPTTQPAARSIAARHGALTQRHCARLCQRQSQGGVAKPRHCARHARHRRNHHAGRQPTRRVAFGCGIGGHEFGQQHARARAAGRWTRGGHVVASAYQL